MKVVGIIQARIGSTRLPAKVLWPICGRPMLEHIVNRARRSQSTNCVARSGVLLARSAH